MAEDIKVIINTLLADEDFLKGVGKIKTGFKEAEKSSKGFFDTIKAKYIAAAAAIGGLIKVIKDSVQAYAEEEKAQRLLQAAFQKTHENAGELTKDFAKWASEMQKVTSFGDEVTVMAAAQLEALTGLSGEGLKKATKAAMDFSVAMGVDIQTAASLIGKTISSSTNALARYGIELKDGRTQSERFANLMDTLNKKFGGFAEKEGASAAGRLSSIKNQFSDLQEVIGKEAFPVLESFMKVFSVLMTSFQSAPDAFKKVGIAAAGLTALLIPLGVALGPIGVAVGALATAGAALVYFLDQKKEADSFNASMMDLELTLLGLQKKFEQTGAEAFADTMKTAKRNMNSLNESFKLQNYLIEDSENKLKNLTARYKEYSEKHKNDVDEATKKNTANLLDEWKTQIIVEKSTIAMAQARKEAIMQIEKDMDNAKKEAAEKEKKRQADEIEVQKKKDIKILEIRKKVLQAEKTLDLETIEGKKEIVKMIDELIEAYEGNEKAIGGLMEIKKEYIALIELEEKNITAASNAMTIYGATASGIADIISSIDEEGGKATKTTLKLTDAFIKLTSGNIAGGIADIVSLIAQMIIDLMQADKEAEDFAKELKTSLKEVAYEAKKITYANKITELENMKKATSEYYDELTNEEKFYNKYLEQKETERISMLRGQEWDEAQIRIAAEKSRKEQNEKKAKEEEEINKKILKYKQKQAEVEKKITILRLKIDMQKAISDVWKEYGSTPEALSEQKKIESVYGELIAAINEAPLPAYGYGGRPTPGKPIIVGDRGTEVFVPDQAGVILSNDMLRGLRFPVGGNSNTYNNNNPVSISGNQFQLNTNNSQELWKQLLKMADNTNSRLLRR